MEMDDRLQFNEYWQTVSIWALFNQYAKSRILFLKSQFDCINAHKKNYLNLFGVEVHPTKLRIRMTKNMEVNY